MLSIMLTSPIPRHKTLVMYCCVLSNTGPSPKRVAVLRPAFLPFEKPQPSLNEVRTIVLCSTAAAVAYGRPFSYECVLEHVPGVQTHDRRSIRRQAP